VPAALLILRRRPLSHLAAAGPERSVARPHVDRKLGGAAEFRFLPHHRAFVVGGAAGSSVRG